MRLHEQGFIFESKQSADNFAHALGKLIKAESEMFPSVESISVVPANRVNLEGFYACKIVAYHQQTLEYAGIFARGFRAGQWSPAL